MKIQFRCGQCGASVQVDDSHAGKTGKCPKCAQPVKIPSAEAIRAARQKKAPSKAAASTPAARPAPAAAPPPPKDDFGLSDLGPRFDDDDFNFADAEVAAQPLSAAPPKLASPTYSLPKAASRSFPHAGFFIRLMALIIDNLIVGFVVGIVFYGTILIGAQTLDPAGNREEMQSKALSLVYIAAIIAFGVIPWLYFAGLEASANQGTVGKMALGIKVVDTHGQPIGFIRATVRYFGKILSALPMYIGFIMAGFTPKKQALHDMIAGCLVVNR
jgi:uncharacterized RDD family membrane protein YckC